MSSVAGILSVAVNYRQKHKYQRYSQYLPRDNRFLPWIFLVSISQSINFMISEDRDESKIYLMDDFCRNW